MRQANPFPGLSDGNGIRALISDDTHAELRERARRAMRHEVNFLGSGWVRLGAQIDWFADFKSATRWPIRPSRGMPVNDLDNPSDIKVPWELSRLQWLLPVGQIYVLDRDEDGAAFAKDTITDWIAANPVCIGPNWICAMDVALRAISMVWLMHACKDSEAWRDRGIQEKLVKSLVLHARFIERNLEFSDVNGNHLAADLAGLALIAIALGGKGLAARWLKLSWNLLCEQLPEQVPADGVCQEGSLPYHRLVAELFALPALARQNVGLHVDNDYLQRLAAMADIVVAATAPDGQVPVWGDADDCRALPLGTQGINDHRYLPGILGRTADSDHDEALWWLGTRKTAQSEPEKPTSAAFDDAGVFVLRNESDVVFVDAGPVGMGGRGGHGHNDCLAVDAVLAGMRLIVDPGSFVYTADWRARNRFRGTAAHNTPMIDGKEINRFSNPKSLWRLRNDAKPEVRHWSTSDDVDLLVASHSGYRRLASPVTPVRAVMLEKSTHRLFLADGFDGDGGHDIETRFTFAPGIVIRQTDVGVWALNSRNAAFMLITASAEDWTGDIGSAEVSPSYGISVSAAALTFRRSGSLKPLILAVIPEASAPPNPVRWLDTVVRDRFPIPGIKN